MRNHNFLFVLCVFCKNRKLREEQSNMEVKFFQEKKLCAEICVDNIFKKICSNVEFRDILDELGNIGDRLREFQVVMLNDALQDKRLILAQQPHNYETSQDFIFVFG